MEFHLFCLNLDCQDGRIFWILCYWVIIKIWTFCVCVGDLIKGWAPTNSPFPINT